VIRRFGAALTPLALVVGVTVAMSSAHYSSGPLPSKTGAPSVGGLPSESNCTQCHLTFGDGGPVNNLNTPGGYVRILDLPSMYVPGNTYTVRVRLWSDSTVADTARRWGFQCTAVKAGDGAGAGSFEVRNVDSLQVIAADPSEPWPTRSYVEHTFNGIHAGEAGPGEWTFHWHAPAQPSGAVYFFVAGNAANGSQDPSGDWIFTAADTMQDTTTAVRPVSWGGLKARWR